MLSFLTCLIGAFAPVSVTYSDIIHINSREIRVSDVVDLQMLELDVRDGFSEKVIATIPANKSSVIMSRNNLVDLVRRRIPGLPMQRHEGVDQLIRIKYVNTEIVSEGRPCYSFKKNVTQGQAVTAEHLRSAMCKSGRSEARLKYNKTTGVLRAASDIAEGSYAGRIFVPNGKFADTNDELVLRVAIGPVQIEKTVWALQPANGADRIFVKDRDGNVLNVPIQQPVSDKEEK